jgi:hypothetical protein
VEAYFDKQGALGGPLVLGRSSEGQTSTQAMKK